ncbi:hypothetical protein ACIGEP_09385 [Microbacterium sp. NPDC077663]|uniref:hypothetical protein n=1 Tax=Microbacterium sp. NPDC077663 TaxID=3364189 RepID=UPI0037C6E6F9
MDDDEAAELTRLRERAYGRTPDIADDAAALARLRELEDRALRRESAEPFPGDAAPADEPAVEDPPVGQTPTPVAAPRRAPRWLVALGAVVAAAVLVAATVAITQAVPDETTRYSGAERATTLSVIDGGGAQANASAGRRYVDFRGYSVFAFTATSPDRPNAECLSIVSPQEAADDSLSTCGAAPFPVSVTTVVSEQSPDAARASYRLGTVLNFTLTSAGVEVWVSER